jgi:hypothetical protein
MFEDRATHRHLLRVISKLGATSLMSMLYEIYQSVMPVMHVFRTTPQRLDLWFSVAKWLKVGQTASMPE